MTREVDEVSIEVFVKNERRFANDCEMILHYVIENPFCTCAKAAEDLGREMHAISGRFTQLRKEGRIQKMCKIPEPRCNGHRVWAYRARVIT